MAAPQVAGQSSVISSTDLPVHAGKQQPAEYDLDQCIAAIKGEKVPSDVTSFWHRRAVIRGIRDSLQFATSPTIIELCSGDDAHQFSRARNARLIMSNVIPDMQPATEPYCIWYPEFASEETYRELASRYPSMRYQVGRACAAALYTDLYKELDLLPDVSIAEEACNAAEDAEIYKIIMSAPQRWAVMDDFTRSVNLESPQAPAFLNGNMKPRRALSQRVLPPENLPDTTADDIDIEEDGFIGFEEEIEIDRDAILGPGDSEYLWMPLSPDLPVLDKRLPTQMAAWEGNVDRYARFMHPRRLRTEIEYNCILRGIYHHTSFARWWAYQLETNPGRIILPGKLLSEGNERERREIRTAINARKIMNNDISDLDDDSDCLPWLIWWPVRPHENTLRELAGKCPSMRPQIAITSILCDYQSLFMALNPPPRESYFEAAKQSRNPYYLQYLGDFVRERSIGSGKISEFDPYDTTKKISLEPDLEPRYFLTHSSVKFSDMAVPWGQHPRGEWDSPGIYGGLPVDPGIVERYMWLSTETAQKIQDEYRAYSGIYGDSVDTGYLYIDDDDPDNELWLKLSRPLRPMTSFEMKTSDVS
ncbi:uncharacterized protein N7518_003086 [Penicillium psychrosexuale]|uniref:uncharacterized protein n=1 Tax=Penicillium psychrosexuale TaxID=1002107 RepID=UPI002544E796|nr:uncharacterized protein N7518_003086 [Penicillium psychrosexuale]KAJ5801018.1 hypothetical protein N7518_003086 [Penicillium psychrosexuale]